MDGVVFDIERTQSSGERFAEGARPSCQLILKPEGTWDGINPSSGFWPDGKAETASVKRVITGACRRLAKRSNLRS